MIEFTRRGPETEFQTPKAVRREGKWFELPEQSFEMPPPVGLVVLPAGRVELFRVQVFAESLERAVATIQEWDRTGIFPRAVYQLPHSTKPDGQVVYRRMYAGWQIENISALYRAMGGRRRGKVKIPWVAKGAPGDCKFDVPAFLERARLVFYRPNVKVDPVTGEETAR